MPAIDRRRTAVFAGVGFAPHVLAVLLAVIIVRTSPVTEGLGDLGKALIAFFAIEIVSGAVCLIGGAVFYRLGRREVGFGLLSGWVVGVVLAYAFLCVAH
jgi:hypothetical protein